MPQAAVVGRFGENLGTEEFGVSSAGREMCALERRSLLFVLVCCYAAL